VPARDKDLKTLRGCPLFSAMNSCVSIREEGP